MDYVLLTDSSCDLPDELAKKYDIGVLPMEYEMDGKNYKYFLDAREMSLEVFYSKLKSGIYATTTQINYDTYIKYFEEYLKQGKDILYICISLGLSGSYNTCKIAVDELKTKYPDRKICLIDACCDSAGQGYLVYKAGEKYKEGYTLEQLRGAEHPHCEVTEEMLSLIDVLVDGRFVEALKDVSLRFRGSSNQRIIDVPKTLARGEIVLWGE